MGKTLKEVKAGLSKERQDKISARAAELIAEEMTMRELRKAMDLTQKELAKKMNKSQDEISRLEARSDILLSTLKKFVGAMGGQLALVAEFPDRDPVVLAGFAAIENEKAEERKKMVRRRVVAASKVAKKKVSA